MCEYLDIILWMIPYCVTDDFQVLNEILNSYGFNESFISFSIKQIFKFHFFQIPSYLCTYAIQKDIDISVIKQFLERRTDDPNFDPISDLFRTDNHKNRLEKLDLLLEFGFNPVTNNNSALRTCMSNGYVDEFHRLLESDIQLENSVEDPAIRNIDLIAGRNTESILGLSLNLKNSMIFLEGLIARGANLNTRVERSGRYPLHFIAAPRIQRLWDEKKQILDIIINALKDQGFLEEQINKEVPELGTPLMICLTRTKMDTCDIETARKLIEEGANINLVCKEAPTGFMSASYYEGDSLIKLNIPSLCVPTRVLCEELDFSSDIIVRIPRVPHDHIYTPLIISIIEHLDTRTEFINKSNNLLFQDHNGATALHHAVLQQDMESVISLYDREPKLVFVKDLNGKTPTEIAFEHGLYSILSVLEPKTQVSMRNPFSMSLDIIVALYHIYLFMDSKKDILSCSQVCRTWRLSMTDELWRDFICYRQFTRFPDIMMYRNAVDRYYHYLHSIKHQSDELKWMDLPKWLFICEEFESLSSVHLENNRFKFGRDEATGLLYQPGFHQDIRQPSHAFLARKIYGKILSFYPILVNYPGRDHSNEIYLPGCPRITFLSSNQLTLYLVDKDHIELFHNRLLVKQLGYKDFYNFKPTHIIFRSKISSEYNTYHCTINEFMDSIRPSRDLSQAISYFLLKSDITVPYIGPSPVFFTRNSLIDDFEQSLDLRFGEIKHYFQNDKKWIKLFDEIEYINRNRKYKKSKTLQVAVHRFILRTLLYLVKKEVEYLKISHSWNIYPSIVEEVNAIRDTDLNENFENSNPVSCMRGFSMFSKRKNAFFALYEDSTDTDNSIPNIPQGVENLFLSNENPKYWPFYLMYISLNIIDCIWDLIVKLLSGESTADTDERMFSRARNLFTGEWKKN
eukprot:TRINITY_DN3303_c0_g1_i1.p1 TRINITY_DN3303_c0_g1~~TRINITY_DN3303_c0_g1_i1.p1  ORF type:complete len:911 (+),score=130.71 TRINITY_DN3303_c0_g1_i1:701-3433(+)